MIGTRRRILLAEDNAVSQRIVKAMLHRLGHEVDIRATGAGAVEACLSFDYLAVLMDGFMPEMDGFEAAREIRRLERRGRRTPIIALTACARPQDRQRCCDCGMDDFLAKPVTLEVLSKALERWTTTSADDRRESRTGLSGRSA